MNDLERISAALAMDAQRQRAMLEEALRDQLQQAGIETWGLESLEKVAEVLVASGWRKG